MASNGPKSEDGKARGVASMRDVAEAAGVSRMAVSRALRPGSSIRPELRAHILSVVERMGYQTDPLVTELMTSFVERRPLRHRETLAVVWWRERWRYTRVPFTFVANLRDGLEDSAARHGCRLDHFVVEALSAGALSRTLVARGIHGVILTPPQIYDTQAPKLDWSRLSVMVIGSSLREPVFSRVHHNHFAACVDVLRRLHALGYRRPLLLLNAEREERMLRAYTAAFLTQETGPSSHVLHMESNDPAPLARRLARLRFDVIIADVDGWLSVLRGLPRAARTGVVSLDVLRRSGPISGVFQNAHRMGECAVDLLMQARLRHEVGVPAGPVSLMTTGEWNEGETLASGSIGADLGE